MNGHSFTPQDHDQAVDRLEAIEPFGQEQLPDERQLMQLLNEVFRDRHINFSQYRENYLVRRVATRMRKTGCQSFDRYMQCLEDDPDEMESLLAALTINVSHFFRDIEVFDVIRDQVLPQLFSHQVRSSDRPVKIWSCGCAGGQEATTMLILVAEHLREELRRSQVRIFGTDIDWWSIAKSRDGVYEEHEFVEMPASLRQKYFVDMGNRRYWRERDLAMYLSFREHDVIGEPPLDNVDLVLCRNTFIYFRQELQQQCVEKFANALVPGGFLVLGKVESMQGMGSIANTFDTVDVTQRIFRKQ